MRYISLFSGVGGLEHPHVKPSLLCEIDPTCHQVLHRLSPTADFVDDVRTLRPGRADLVAGGFPCQDLSVAGRMHGLVGTRSGLFYEMVRVASEAHADHLVIENVPNLLRLSSGSLMRTVIDSLSRRWPYISWRTLNARQFALPQQRRRCIIIASRDRSVALKLFRAIRSRADSLCENPKACGFYTTAGSRSICYSRGYVPTLKVGSSINIPTPPGIHLGTMIRKASASECLALQGFERRFFRGMSDRDVYRTMGNAVPVPMGRFAMRCIDTNNLTPPRLEEARMIGWTGFFDGQLWAPVGIKDGVLATNLDNFVEPSDDSLSRRAASGLVRRLERSGTGCPADLFRQLKFLSRSASHQPVTDKRSAR